MRGTVAKRIRQEARLGVTELLTNRAIAQKNVGYYYKYIIKNMKAQHNSTPWNRRKV
jgi:hypothetical protein